MAAASYEWATADTHNAAIIAGQGEGAERAVQAVYTQEGLSGAKLRETFVDARDLDTDAGLIARGQNKLKRLLPHTALPDVKYSKITAETTESQKYIFELLRLIK